MAIKRFGKSENIYDRAVQTWQILAPWVSWKMKDEKYPAMRGGLITYGTLAERLGYGRRAGKILARRLAKIAIFCKMEGLPALNAVVVRADTASPGDGVLLAKHCHEEDEIEATLAHDWLAYKIPTARQIRSAWEKHQSLLEE